MNCDTCHDAGIVRLNFQEGDEYGLCLCSEGERMRSERNHNRQAAPMWRVWCAREQVDPILVRPIEDVLTPAELAERGFTELAPAAAIDAIAAAARSRKR